MIRISVCDVFVFEWWLFFVVHIFILRSRWDPKNYITNSSNLILLNAGQGKNKNVIFKQKHFTSFHICYFIVLYICAHSPRSMAFFMHFFLCSFWMRFNEAPLRVASVPTLCRSPGGYGPVTSPATWAKMWHSNGGKDERINKTRWRSFAWCRLMFVFWRGLSWNSVENNWMKKWLG